MIDISPREQLSELHAVIATKSLTDWKVCVLKFLCCFVYLIEEQIIAVFKRGCFPYKKCICSSNYKNSLHRRLIYMTATDEVRKEFYFSIGNLFFLFEDQQY